VYSVEGRREVVLSLRPIAPERGEIVVYQSPLENGRAKIGRVIDVRAALVAVPSSIDGAMTGFTRKRQVIMDGPQSEAVPPVMILGRPLAVIWPPSQARFLE
jgi:hypothetical protein